MVDTGSGSTELGLVKSGLYDTGQRWRLVILMVVSFVLGWAHTFQRDVEATGWQHQSTHSRVASLTCSTLRQSPRRLALADTL
jgi:hypothetical protein